MKSSSKEIPEQPPTDDVQVPSGGVEKIPTKHLGSEDRIKAMDWTGFVAPDPNAYLGGGAFGDVFHGKWIGLAEPESHTLPRIVMKKFRVSQSNLNNKKLQKRV